jgi:ribosome biogenesis GTPase / thiamine phosphate phosphatase
MNTLATYGWDDKRAAEWAEREPSTLVPARIIADHGQQYKVALPDEMAAQLSGASVHKLSSVDMPKIGDWVAVEIDGDFATIHHVLPRVNEIVRGHVGRMVDKQVVAANIDLAFIVQPLDHDFSPERLERYIFQLSSQNIAVVILLNKSDKALDASDKQAELANLGVDTVIMSATNDGDMSSVERYISPGKTFVILGSSGAGKSTLTNRLLGEQVQATAEIRAKDSKGRHTTVHRELFVLPSGGMIIDTPGIRELQLWGDQADLEHSFPEIFEAMRSCRYKNCSHGSEDGCAIVAGLADGTIDARRYRIYLSFKRELQTLDDRRGFIEERRSQQSRESAKRRRARTMRSERDKSFNDD